MPKQNPAMLTLSNTQNASRNFGCRALEDQKRKKHDRRDRKNPSDLNLYRIQYLEMTIPAFCEWMNITGKQELQDDNFHVGIRKMMELMPFQIRKMGRSTSMCRYHMEFDHDCECGRRWSVMATKDAGCGCKWPANDYEMRSSLMCTKGKYNGSDFHYYPIKCVNRLCKSCKTFKSFTCEKCRAAVPHISFMKWLPVPYHCKDGRELESHDFVKTHGRIEEFLEMCDSHCTTFFPHHERAKWQDEDSAFMRRNIHKFGMVYNEGTGAYGQDGDLGYCLFSVEDFSNSYTHAPKYEHAGRFFHAITTTLYGCILYLPLDAASDSYIPPTEKAKLHKLFKENGKPPILMVSTFGISPDPHHTTAFVQHYHKKHLAPWLTKNFPLANRVHFLRSDGCVG